MRVKKYRDLAVITAIYLFSFILGSFAGINYDGIMAKLFAFDVVATVVVFIFSVIYRNSSVYDAYWSVAPIVMIFWLFSAEHVRSAMHLIFLAVFLMWAVRLTMNWVEVFTDFSYEDWRYRKYRDETPRIFWPIVNFFGIHMMPTLVVFAGMLPIFVIAKVKLDYMALPGMAVMVMGILFEYFADRQMHAFLNEGKPGEVCNVGLWKYSRHPNYLGEISFWTGVYLVMLPYAAEYWYYGIGCLSVCVLFNVVSIPLMEHRQLSRRPQYSEYMEKTSRLLPKPQKSAEAE